MKCEPYALARRPPQARVQHTFQDVLRTCIRAYARDQRTASVAAVVSVASPVGAAVVFAGEIGSDPPAGADAAACAATLDCPLMGCTALTHSAACQHARKRRNV